MKLDIKNFPQSEIEMFFELDPKEWNEFINEAAKELGREVKIDGFRPGQAPRQILEQKIGWGKILQRSADLAVRETYVKTVLDKGLEPINRPEIQVLKMAQDNPFEFKVKVAVMPELKIADYKHIAQNIRKKPSQDIKVEEKEIEETLNWLQKSRTKYVTVARPAQKGDRLEIDFSAKYNGKEIATGENKNHSLILGEVYFAPGFEDQLLGLKENEEKKFSLLFPEDFKQKEWAGNLIDFEVKIKLVQESQPPPLSDEFAQSLGAFKDLTALRQSIEDGLKKEKELKEKEIWRAQVLEVIAQKSEVVLPQILIDSEIAKMLEGLKASVAELNLDFETYLKNIQKTAEDLKKEWLAKAKERLMATLTLRTISQKEKMEVSEEELENEINKFLTHYPRATGKDEIDTERLKEYTKGSLINEKVFQFLESFSK